MKPSLPLPVLAGLALTGLVFLATGAIQASSRTIQIPSQTIRTVYLQGPPVEWWTYFSVRSSNWNGVVENETYTVSSDRYFVLSNTSGNLSDLRVNDVGPGYPPDVPDWARPPLQGGTVFPPGTGFSLRVADNGQRLSCNFWGYLHPTN